MFTRAIKTSILVHAVFLNERGGGVSEIPNISSPLRETFSGEQAYVPMTRLIHEMKKEEIGQMTVDPRLELESGLSAVFGMPSSISTEASYKPDIVLVNGRTGREQTKINLEGTAEKSRQNILRMEEESKKRGSEAFEAMQEFGNEFSRVIDGNIASEELRQKLKNISFDDLQYISQEIEAIQVDIVRAKLRELGDKVPKHELEMLVEQNKFLFGGSSSLDEVINSEEFLAVLIRKPELLSSDTQFLNNLEVCNVLIQQAQVFERKLYSLESTHQIIESEKKNIQAINNSINEYEREYDKWEKNEQDQENDNNTELSKNPVASNEGEYSDTSSLKQRMMFYHSKKIDNFLEHETGSTGSNLIVQETDSGNFVLLREDGQLLTEAGWGNFSTRREANRAEIRYRLFSEPPLDIIRNQGPKKIEQLMGDTNLRDIWNSENPGEPFRAKALRRLILVALMKKMDPIKYGNMSYNEIIKNQSRPLIDQFRTMYHNPEFRIKLGLGSIGSGEEAVGQMLAIVRDMKTAQEDKEDVI